MSLEKITQYRAITLFTLITLISLLWTMMLNHAEFSAYETGIFILYVGGIFLIQLGILFSILAVKKIASIFGALIMPLAVIFTTFNAFTLVIVHNSRFAALDGALFIGFISALAIGIGVVLAIKNKTFVKFTHTFSLIMLALIGLQFVGSGVKSIEGLLDRMPDSIKMVEFKTKPNIYVISFDALVPEKVAKDIIGVKNVPYANALKRQDVRFIPNTFAENIPTKRSLNMTLAMDTDHYNNVSENCVLSKEAGLSWSGHEASARSAVLRY